MLERGDLERRYGPNHPATLEMGRTWGAEKMRREYGASGCQSGEGDYKTLDAYLESFRKPGNGTLVWVGGFRYRFFNNGNGTVTYSIYNEPSKESFFYHIYDWPVVGPPLRIGFPFFRNKERGGDLPFMGTMKQEFEWTEPNP